jgi:phosphoglycerol transferase MdoB-like AlkP superfamily enzyme
MKDVPGNANMEKHAMGLHDAYVLDFMEDKITKMQQPFFTVNYNTSTHYPNELPKNYVEKYPAKNFSAQMKSMNYYNECLQQFFSKAALQPWFKNTVFIFCSDHWMFPDFDHPKVDIVDEFHIPIIIYNPADEQKKTVTDIVSQLDIMNTVLAYSANKNNFISYGNSLLQPAKNGIAFSRETNILYQAIDSSYVLGFNVVSGKPEYCYNYKTDALKKDNLSKYKSTPEIDTLVLKMKAFLQTATTHYQNKQN